MVFFDDKAATINDLIEAVEAVEHELGLTPSGVYASVRTRLDILEARINNPFAPAPNVENPFFIGNDGVTISTGFGAPTEDRIPGSLYLREDGYNIQGLYARRPDGYWHQIDTDPFTASRDLAGTIYSQTVVGLQNHDINPDASLLQTDAAGDGYVLTWNATANGGIGWWEPQIGFFAFGDLSGTKINQTVIRLQNRTLSAAAPQDGYSIIWNAGAVRWEPQRLAVVFDPLDNSTTTNIRSNRYTTQSPVDNTKTGILNLSSDTSQATLGAAADYATILGGDQNQADADYAVVVGGLTNVNSGIMSFIGAGSTNAISTGGDSSFIGSGTGNTVGGANSVVGGGTGNNLSGTNSVIAGGNTNTMTDDEGFIGGGNNNQITASGTGNVIAGGNTSSITGTSRGSSIVGGFNNTIQDSNVAAILAGTLSLIESGSDESVIVGGDNHDIRVPFSFIGSGSANTIAGVDGYSAILGGSGNLTIGKWIAILAGQNNTASGNYSIIADGYSNTITASNNSTILNGDNNSIITANYSTILNGSSNVIHSFNTILAGTNNAAAVNTDFSMVLGDSNTLSSGANYSSVYGNSNSIGNSAHIGIWGTSNTVNNTANYSLIFGDGNTINTGADHSRVLGSTNIVGTSSSYSFVAGSSNIVANSVTNTLTVGTSNAMGSSFSAAIGQRHNVLSSTNGSFVHGQFAKAKNPGQYSHANTTFTPNTAGSAQFARLMMAGSGASGASITLTTDGANNLLLEDGYTYDMFVKIEMTQTSGTTGVCARYQFDVLAHRESGTLTIDRVNTYLVTDNGTGWVGNNWTGIFNAGSTTIAVGSNGANLATATTINVLSTTGFPTSGTIYVQTSTGIQQVTYTGTSGGTQFTGCSVLYAPAFNGSLGTMSTGGTVYTLVGTTGNFFVTMPASGSQSRRAVASIEWREVTRL